MSGEPHRPRSSAEWRPFNAEVIADHRANGGHVERFGDLRVMVLHTIGARSGEVREVPLFTVDHVSGLLVYGTAEGAARDPGWVHNLRAHPDITVEYGAELREATFEELPPVEAAAVLDAHAATTPMLATYLASAAPRRVPVFRIHFGQVS
ncbi:MAG: nitroreductase family deazaflavin-dependent oxidoreductase [Actinomycetota bacterium]